MTSKYKKSRYAEPISHSIPLGPRFRFVGRALSDLSINRMLQTRFLLRLSSREPSVRFEEKRSSASPRGANRLMPCWEAAFKLSRSQKVSLDLYLREDGVEIGM